MVKKSPSKEVATKSSKTPHYEFFGPPGAVVISLGLPILCYAFILLCNDISGCPVPCLVDPQWFTIQDLKEEVGWPSAGIFGLWSTKATFWVFAYYLLNLTLFTFLPGPEVTGTVLQSGGRLKYKFNAFTTALILLGGCALGTAVYGPNFPVWTFIWNNQGGILTANLLIAVFLASFCYHRSFSVRGHYHAHRELAAGGHTGNMIYDWFIGRELNPRITLPLFGEIDIKAWCEMRPGLIGWILLDLTFAAKQYAYHGYITDSMVLSVGAQTLYVLDALYMEPAMLTTIDITTDGFGFMLAFGDLVWLPVVYSLQARYLAVYPVHLGPAGIAGVLAVLGSGYYIFRAANNEKNRFRTDPSDPRVKHLESITTATGSKLITSGWWGRARHINYLGDWLMSWAYCLPTGVAGYLIRPHITFPLGGNPAPPERPYPLGSPSAMASYQGDARGWGMVVTYFFMLYFAVLLIHRERRDEEKCAKKYGKHWEEYKKKVPYRIVPYVY